MAVRDGDLFEFDGDREMPNTVEDLLTMAAEQEVERSAMHELGRCHELEGPCQLCWDQARRDRDGRNLRPFRSDVKIAIRRAGGGKSRAWMSQCSGRPGRGARRTRRHRGAGLGPSQPQSRQDPSLLPRPGPHAAR